jgi:methylmalonyl-CoA/ethylmalonyl-CoA epimerase
MIREVTDVGLAVRDIERATADISHKLMVSPTPILDQSDPPILARTSLMRIANIRIAVIQSLAEGSPVDRFIAKRGEGLFSVVCRVDNLEETSNLLRERGVRLVAGEPYVLEDPTESHASLRIDGRTYRSALFNWTHPKDLHGLALELVEFRE